jgi:phenylpyruvate tautomerase PptA (4-oxalocrotonate tautomerase family)
MNKFSCSTFCLCTENLHILIPMFNAGDEEEEEGDFVSAVTAAAAAAAAMNEEKITICETFFGKCNCEFIGKVVRERERERK